VLAFNISLACSSPSSLSFGSRFSLLVFLQKIDLPGRADLELLLLRENFFTALASGEIARVFDGTKFHLVVKRKQQL
jgi:hypothetical protein